MRYIGSKDNLLPFIHRAVDEHGITGGVFCDLFAGTTVVGRSFKRRGYRVISNDLMAYAYVFGKAYIETNALPQFPNLALPGAPACPPTGETAPLEQVLAYLNALPPQEGFVYANYSDGGTQSGPYQRMYFSAHNAGKIDAIRTQIERWRQAGAIDESAFYVLLAALLEAIPGVSNISGTYGAFLKYWEPRSQKTLTLTLPPLVPGSEAHHACRCDANALAREIACDVLYLDPPYNTRQYATNYHLLETVARWDSPAIYGKSGLRPYAGEKSVYCGRDTAAAALDDLIGHAHCRLLLLSYNSEGIIPHATLCDMLSRRGRLTVQEQPYRRFRSDRDHARRRYASDAHVVERLYIVECRES